MTEVSRQRIDKWLWHVRVTKTRSLAQKLVSSGKVRIDGTKTHSPSHQVKIGDVLTIAMPNAVKLIRVDGFVEKRVSFPIACQLYTDLSPPVARDKTPKDNPFGEIKPDGKPDKRARRQAMLMKQTPEH